MKAYLKGWDILLRSVRKNRSLLVVFVFMLVILTNVAANSFKQLNPSTFLTRRWLSPEERQAITRDRYDVYKLGSYPINLSINDQDYDKLEAMCYDKPFWGKKEIINSTLRNARDRGCVIVYDRAKETGFEIPKDELTDFLLLLYNIDISNQLVDVVEIEKGPTTKEASISNLSVNVGNVNAKTIYLEATDVRLQKLEDFFKDAPEKSQRENRKLKNSINLKIGTVKINEEDVEDIARILDTGQARELGDSIRLWGGAVQTSNQWNLIVIIFIAIALLGVLVNIIQAIIAYGKKE